MALGLGSRYPGTAKTRQAISQNMTRTAITTIGSQISCVRRSSDGRRRTGARVVTTAGSGCTGAPPAENAFADARGAIVEVMAAPLVETARPRPRHADPLEHLPRHRPR